MFVSLPMPSKIHMYIWYYVYLLNEWTSFFVTETKWLILYRSFLILPDASPYLQCTYILCYVSSFRYPLISVVIHCSGTVQKNFTFLLLLHFKSCHQSPFFCIKELGSYQPVQTLFSGASRGLSVSFTALFLQPVFLLRLVKPASWPFACLFWCSLCRLLLLIFFL